VLPDELGAKHFIGSRQSGRDRSAHDVWVPSTPVVRVYSLLISSCIVFFVVPGFNTRCSRFSSPLLQGAFSAVHRANVVEDGWSTTTAS